MRLCSHSRMWLVAGHVCNCAVLFAEWVKRRGSAQGKGGDYMDTST